MELANFLAGVTSKTRLIILLVSHGYTFDQIRNMPVSELKDFRSNIPDNLPDLLDVCDDISAVEDVNKKAFTYTSGRPYSVKNISDILQRAHSKVGIKYQGRENFLSLLAVRGSREKIL